MNLFLLKRNENRTSRALRMMTGETALAACFAKSNPAAATCPGTFIEQVTNFNLKTLIL